MAICTKCGNCCKVVTIKNATDNAKTWAEARGLKVSNGHIIIDSICPSLKDNLCSVNDCKPEACKEFIPGSDPICPLYKKGGDKNMVNNMRLKKIGDNDPIEIKQFEINEFKTVKGEDGSLSIEGYANTKNKADRYGDIPTVFSALRNYVYELEQFHKNPVALLNHNNSTDNIVGSFNEKLGGYIYEDEIGLKFKLVFSKSDFPPVAHARTIYAEGHGRALSIGGNWYFEDADNADHLTYAKIFEVSLVGVGADPDALTKIKSIAKDDTARNPQVCIADIEESIKAGHVLSEDELKRLESVLTLNKKEVKTDPTDDDMFEMICKSINSVK